MESLDEIRNRFCRDAVRYGFDMANLRTQIRSVYTFPPGKSQLELLERWLRQLNRTPKELASIPRSVRLCNEFKLGADPEFVFSDTVRGRRIDAMQFGFKTGRAFGADTNGRLAELRPHPSRSAVEVVASLLAAMRWMAVCHPDSLGYHWVAGAYQFQDGLGGHVHFGRKRPTREDEVTALDQVSGFFKAIGGFPAAEMDRRAEGDAHGQRYGLPHDFRLQNHGYEYRTFPSWLDSPWLAFLVITVAKIAVHDPGLTKGLWQEGYRTHPFAKLRNLLGIYKSIDDDARLAVIALEKYGFPVFRGGDFKAHWGIQSNVAKKMVPPKIIPPAIPSDAEGNNEIISFLLDGIPIRPSSTITLVPTWKPTDVPAGYQLVMDSLVTHGIRTKGMGEALWDVVGIGDRPITFIGDESRNYIQVTAQLIEEMPAGAERTIRGLLQGRDHLMITQKAGREISIGKKYREPSGAGLLRKVLLGGAFPLWRVDQVTRETAQQWKKLQRKNSSSVFKSKVLFNSR